VVKVEPLAGIPSVLRATSSCAQPWKRSFAVDLKTPEGQGAVRRLAETCAVVLHNLRPGVAERDGLGYTQLAAANPGLVYVHVSGFGTDTSLAARPAYDPLGAALAGVQRAQGGPAEENPPSLVRTPVCDVGAGTVFLSAPAAAAGASPAGTAKTSSSGSSSGRRNRAWYEGGRTCPNWTASRSARALCWLYPAADGWLFLVARTTGPAAFGARVGVRNSSPSLADQPRPRPRFRRRDPVAFIALVRRRLPSARPRRRGRPPGGRGTVAGDPVRHTSPNAAPAPRGATAAPVQSVRRHRSLPNRHRISTDWPVV
jgi:crotonobetainyl-CoA:carnitine CoA-transferase CaiB-like acyl-CoA transferase